ncbi:hypothetical protein GGP41_000840 [Bipolaris sorokiniana]|uniref:Uncharacterized protein n=1 Tax=Cochliobolus sativus TaxID=45130 RepID=A0A8H6DXJ0_COCSA|nr:hypothetical protein GGP41_000840 [Bipolaris sorokiniana]
MDRRMLTLWATGGQSVGTTVVNLSCNGKNKGQSGSREVWPAKSHERRPTSLTTREEKTSRDAQSTCIIIHIGPCTSSAGQARRLGLCVESQQLPDQSVSASASANASASASASASCPTHSRSSNNLMSMSIRCQAGVNTCLCPSVSMHTHPPAAAGYRQLLPQVNTCPRINSR